MHGEWIVHSVSLLYFLLKCIQKSVCLSSVVKNVLDNPWSDIYLGNKRPYDGEFFSFLLKRILAKDKQKGKSIKLVVKSSKAKKGKGNMLKCGGLRSLDPTVPLCVCVCVTLFIF